MNKEQFFTYLDTNNQLTAGSIPYLKEVKEKYPYFQTGQVLYAKALHLNNDNNFEDELRKVAIRVHNRKKLYDFIHFQPENYFSPIVKKEPAKNEKPTVEATPTPKSEIEEKPETEKAQPQQEKAENKEPDKLEKQYLTEMIGAGYLERLGKGDFPQSTNLQQTEKPKQEDTKQPETFSDWVSFFDGKPQKAEKKTSNIDEFIKKVEAHKKASKAPTPFFSAENMARESVRENDDYITETLANIYYQQGNFEKALDAYQKLSLKYPKKGTYFASQIKLIKSKL